MKLFAFGLFVIVSMTGCYSTKSVPASATGSRSLPAQKIAIKDESSGAWEYIQPAESPTPEQGNQQWTRDFYGAIRYPASARENSISGIVILEVIVDALGQVKTVEILQSLNRECDEEARRAFIASTQAGYTPLYYEHTPMAFKLEIPVGFWLE